MIKSKNIIKKLALTGILICGFSSFAFTQEITDTIDNLNFDNSVVLTPAQIQQKKHLDLFSKAPTPPTNVSIASLRFSWNAPVSMATFTRNNKIWIVFDRPNRFDAKKLTEDAKGLAKEIYTLPHPIGNIIVITPAENVKHSLRKEGLLWIVDLYTDIPPQFKSKDMTIFTQYDSLKQSYLFVPNNHAGNIISFLDPEIGDIISVSTTSQLGLGFNSTYRYPDFDILPSKQGLAFVINAPDIVLNRGNSGVTLKAIGRSLNITSDLDVLKRNQRRLDTDKDTAHINAFDLQISQNLASKTFLDVVDDFKKQILSSPLDQKNSLRLKLAHYYVHNGLGTNALYILNQMRKLELPESKTDRFFALSGVANFLARRYKQAISDFSQGNIPNSPEGIFWKTIAQSASDYKEESNSIIFSHISLMRDYPQAIKDEVAIIAARNAIATGDDLSSQNFIDILNSVPDRNKDLNPQITYLSAQRLEMQGYIRSAIKEYQNLLSSDSPMFSAYARLRHTVLSQVVNFIDTKAAITELEKLRFAWGEIGFKINLLNKLADFYLKDKDYYNALKTLKEESLLADEEKNKVIIAKMIKIFEDIFIGNHADENLSAIKSLALYQDFKWLAQLSSNHNMIIQKLADRLVAVDLLPRAENLLLSLLNKKDLSIDSEARIGSRLAVIYLFQNKPSDALNILKATEHPNLSEETTNPRKIIYARALSALNRPDEALAILDSETSTNALLNKFEIYWNAQDWSKASDTIKHLIEEPKPGEKLSEQQIGYILDWATTLKQAGKETVLVRLRNKFKPYFKGTPYYSAFNVLTSHLEKEKIDIKAINSIINDVQNFNKFSKFYTETLKENNSQE